MALITVPNVFTDNSFIFAYQWNNNFVTFVKSLGGSIDTTEFKFVFNGANPVLKLNQKDPASYIVKAFLNSFYVFGIKANGQLESIATPPFILSSTTKINNLNVDKLDNLVDADIIKLTGGEVTPGNITTHANPVSNMQLANKQYTDANSASFMASGTVLLFGGNPPAGWTRVNASEDRILRLAKAAETVGNATGGWVISGLFIDFTILDISQIPSHDHTFSYSQTMPSNAITLGPEAICTAIEETGQGNNVTTTPVGSNTGHNHGNSPDGNWRPRYEIWAESTKD